MPRRSFREVLRKGRRDIHEQLEVPALYIAFDGADPVPVDIRVHRQFAQTGDMGSKVKGYAQMVEVSPRVIFLVEQLADARNGGIFSVVAGEAYRVERTDPTNDITRTADVSIMPLAETIGLPIPVVELP
jgi:hypothetical protein